MNTTAENLLGKSWAKKIGNEFQSEYMTKISSFLNAERKKKVIYPTNDYDIFTVFRDTKFEDIRVIIVGQDPYHDGSYCGMAFANREDSERISPSLRNIFKELESDIYNGLLLNPDITLKNWQKQGVFLINTSLTVEKGKPGSHSHIGWRRFVGKAVKALYEDKRKKVFILWGNYAINFFLSHVAADFSLTEHLILTSVHPSPLSANRGFFGSKPFSKVNEFLSKDNQQIINW